MRSGHGGIDGYPSDIDNEASKFRWEENKDGEKIVSIPDSEIKIDVDKREQEPIHEEDWEISSEKIEDVNVDEKRENTEGSLEDNKVSKEPKVAVEERDLTPEELGNHDNLEKDGEIRNGIDEKQGIIQGANIENKPKAVGLNGIRNEETMMNEHFKEISEKEKPKNIVASEISEIKWNGMVKELESMLKEATSSKSSEKWYEIILHIGEMNKRDSKKFNELKEGEENPFNNDIKVEMIQQIEATSKKGEEVGEKADPLKLASKADNFLECFPEYKGKINITPENKKDIKQNADEYRSRSSDYAIEDLASLKSKGDQWKVEKTREAEKMIKNRTKSGEIKVAA